MVSTLPAGRTSGAVQSDRQLAVGTGLIALAMAAVVGGALGFEHIGGYIPCALCLEQRVPYYVGVPVLLIAAGAAWVGSRTLALIGLLIAAALMAWAIYLGVYHAGAEWGFWPGPTDCGVSAAGAAAVENGNLLEALNSTRPPSCDEAAGRFLGLSFAGWQVVAATGLLVASLVTAQRARRP